MPFYIRDLRIRRFWCLRGFLHQSPMDTKGQLWFLVHKVAEWNTLRTGHPRSYWGIWGPRRSAISTMWMQMTSCEMLAVLVHVAAHRSPQLHAATPLLYQSWEETDLSSPCSPVVRKLSLPSVRPSSAAFFCTRHLNTTHDHVCFLYGFSSYGAGAVVGKGGSGSDRPQFEFWFYVY